VFVTITFTSRTVIGGMSRPAGFVGNEPGNCQGPLNHTEWGLMSMLKILGTDVKQKAGIPRGAPAGWMSQEGYTVYRSPRIVRMRCPALPSDSLCR